MNELQRKISLLQTEHRRLLAAARKETARLEKEFAAAQTRSRGTLAEEIKRWSGRYYAKVGPLLKQARVYRQTLELLHK